MNDWLLYGAYGYSGRLILNELERRDLPMPVLAGRNPEKLSTLAKKYKTKPLALELSDERNLRKSFAGYKLVLNVAGPFSKTFKPVLEACLNAKCHYLDITGEVGVFERIYECDFRAKTIGVTLLPGVGFDVIPTDCLAATLKMKLPNATYLGLAFHTKGKVSHGTLKTVLENIPNGGLIRKNGNIKFSPSGALTREIQFEHGKPELCMSIPWGDIASAYRSTGIPNIAVYTAVSPLGLFSTRMINLMRPLLKGHLIQSAMGYFVDRFVEGPSIEERDAGFVALWGEARDESGVTWHARARVSDGYKFTATGAVEAVQKLLAGGVPHGALTPSQAFGANFLEDLDDNFKIRCEKIL